MKTGFKQKIRVLTVSRENPSRCLFPLVHTTPPLPYDIHLLFIVVSSDDKKRIGTQNPCPDTVFVPNEDDIAGDLIFRL